MILKKTILLLLLIACIFACEESEVPLETEPEEPMVIEYGTVSGSVTDAETGNLIPGVTVILLGQSMETGLGGIYTFQNVIYGDNHTLMTEDADYKPYSQSFALRQQRVTVDVALTPLRDSVQEMRDFFDRFSDLLESVDTENIEAIESQFSETYVAADDDATLFGVASGIIPENYADIVPAMTQLFEEYVFLEFLFNNIQMDITHARKASVTLQLDVNARKEMDEDLREIKAGCKFDFRREGADWKIVYWQLLEIDIRL